MKPFAAALILPLMLLVLAGCRTEQSSDSSNTAVFTKPTYYSDTSPEDCYLCGGGIESLVPSEWGQNNLALISLNTFEMKPIEINRYDRLSGQLIEEYAGVVSFSGGGSVDGGFSASLLLDYDYGHADGSVEFHNDKELDISKLAGFLCEDCLNEILPWHIERCFGVGVINLATKKVRVFEECLGAFALGDFYIHCDLYDQDADNTRMGLLIFYCPLRYEPSPG